MFGSVTLRRLQWIELHTFFIFKLFKKLSPFLVPPKTIKTIQDNLLPHIVCQCKVHFSCYWEDNNRGAFHFIKHLAGSEPRTHRGGGKCSSPCAPEGLGGAPAWGGGQRGECSSVGRCMGVDVEEEERGARNGGAGGGGRVLWRGAMHGRRRRRRGARGTVGDGFKFG